MKSIDIQQPGGVNFENHAVRGVSMMHIGGVSSPIATLEVTGTFVFKDVLGNTIFSLTEGNMTTHFSSLPIKTRCIAGGAAGNLSCPGVSVGDQLLGIVGFKLTEGTPNTMTPGGFLSEFTITAADTINNTGGTNTTGYVLFVTFNDMDA